MNAIDPKVGAKMYDFVIWEGKTLRGEEAAAKLIENQTEGIQKAVAAGMLVKVNTVMVAGINDDHIPEVAKKVKSLGAYVVNIIPMIPVPGTKFADLKAPTAEQRKKLQDLCEPDIKQMRHCRSAGPTPSAFWARTVPPSLLIIHARPGTCRSRGRSRSRCRGTPFTKWRWPRSPGRK